MEQFRVTKVDSNFHIKGFPDAVKVVAIEGQQGKRLADIALHQSDLKFAAKCLETINQVSDRPNVLRQALWQGAVIRYMKCFGVNKARFQLNANKIYQGG